MRCSASGCLVAEAFGVAVCWRWCFLVVDTAARVLRRRCRVERLGEGGMGFSEPVERVRAGARRRVVAQGWP